MPGQARIAPAGLVYHVLSRAVGRLALLQKPEDYAAFERVLGGVHRRCPMRLLAYCLMPNHLRVEPPRDWLRTVYRPRSKREPEAIRRAVQRNSPFGAPSWMTTATSTGTT